MNSKKQAVFFIDGQNLFNKVKTHYGYQHPNFDVVNLCQNLAKRKNAEVEKIHFYSGLPGQTENPHWHDYWLRRMDSLSNQGVDVFNPPIKYRMREDRGYDGQMRKTLHGSEKGVDVKIAIDMFKEGLKGTDLIIVLSQDNDLAVAAKEIQTYARETGKAIEVCSAFPTHGHRSTRGIEGTIWMPFTKEFYDANIDPMDFRTDTMKKIHDIAERKLAMGNPHDLYENHGNGKHNRNMPGDQSYAIRRRAEEARKIVGSLPVEKPPQSDPKRF